MKTAGIVVWEGAGAQPWRWHLKAPNGKTIAQGEGHPTRAKAVRAAKGVVNTIHKSIAVNASDEPLRFVSYVSLDQTYINWS